MMGSPIDLLAAPPVVISDMGALLPLVVSHVPLVLLSVLILGEGHSAAEGESEAGDSQDSGQSFHSDTSGGLDVGKDAWRCLENAAILGCEPA
jgi:hypothetical protein